MQEMTETWIQVAKRPKILSRSLRVAMLVGTILVLLNYTDRFIMGDITWIDVIKMLLTYLVPFIVSTHASVSAVRENGYD
jgi:hypothetical protein